MQNVCYHFLVVVSKLNSFDKLLKHHRMKRLLILFLGIFLITFESCKQDDEVNQPDSPQINILSGTNGSVERGSSLSIELMLEAQAGIDKLTMNGDLVNGIRSGDTEQSINIPLETAENAELGNVIYEFRLTDQVGDEAITQYTLLVAPGGTFQSDTVSLYDNSVLIDQSIELMSTPEQIESGRYIFQSADLDISSGDVIAGPQNGGYLRIVESVETNGEQTILSTSPGNITNLFKETEIKLDFGKLIENTNGRTLSESSFREDFNNLKLIEENGSSLTVNGFVELDANYNLELDIEDGSLKSVDFTTSGTTLDLSLLTSIQVSDNLDVANSTYEIISISKSFYSVSPPVFGTVNFKLKSVISSAIDASITADIITRDKVQIDFRSSYSNGSWTKSLDTQELISEGSADLSGIINISNEIKLIPEVDIKLYGVSGPFFKPEAFATLNLGVASPSLNWDAYSEIGYGGSFGFKSDILGDILNFESTIEGEKFKVWEAPHSIEVISGNDQQISQNSKSDPLKVKVLDNLGNLVAGIPVYYEITEGNGTLDTQKDLSNSNGSAESVFTASNNIESVSISSNIKNRNSSILASLDFNIEVEEVQDSTAIYQEAVVGDWSVITLESGNMNNLRLFPGGDGRYIIPGPNGANKDGIDENGDSYYIISWSIQKINDRYHLRESGFYHFGFESYRSFDISMPDNYLTYPVSSFKTYNDFSNGDGPYASRQYDKK